jgi:hypothetical protein
MNDMVSIRKMRSLVDGGADSEAAEGAPLGLGSGDFVREGKAVV